MKKKPLRHFKIVDHLYRQYFLFVVGDKEETKKYLKQFDGLEDVEFRKMTAGKMIADNENGGIVIWLEEFNATPDDFGILAHELLHAVHQSFIFHHVAVDAENDETAGYYIEFLMSEFLKKWRKLNYG